MGIKEAAACVKENNKFLITAHTNLEGDALGSELAFLCLLKALGKDGVIINDDKVPEEYNFLPGINNIKKFDRSTQRPQGHGLASNSQSQNIKFDCFTALDCSDLKRCAEVAQLNTLACPVLNIDHHISNDYFGDINWVNPAASSCAEMIYQLYKEMKISFNKDSALFLYVGILMDTGSFRYSNTTSFTHKAAAELLGYKIDPVQVYKNLYENVPFEDMKLLSRVLPDIKREPGGKIIWFQVKKDMLAGKKILFDLTEHMLSFGRLVKGVEVVVIFKENLKTENEVRVNFRSQGKFDVNEIARFFGGGGHKAASGCTIKGKINDVRRSVLRKIKENLK